MQLNSGLAQPIVGYTRLREDLDIETLVEPGQPERFVLRDRDTEESFVLGKRELLVARMFDGMCSIDRIVERLRDEHGVRASEATVKQFEERMVALGILTDPSRPSASRVAKPRSQSAGITYGPFKRVLMITLFRFDPHDMLDAMMARMPWLATRTAFGAFGVLVLAACVMLGLNAHTFARELVTVYSTGFAWIPIHYAVVIASIVVHEFGHALACRAYRVRVTEIGVAVYVVIATGWAWPVQREWSRLDKTARGVTIFAGPFASLVFAAVAVFVWAWAAPGSAARYAATVAIASPSLALIPTLLPIFNGDGYLAMTEFLNMPRLRQRAFSAFMALVRGRRVSLTRRETLTYTAMVIGTLGGWFIVWANVARIAVSAVAAFQPH
ncbi:hypothetical protein C0Z18_31260 [Trinickia dabaoshanensis]|uniref:Peptidase M50 domain-containing protein n=1 Tax=Trinickia dabaoshanensis TaxID=564714 RepID=A0A2N7VBH5_9BURK|nr:hypothetical protein C0Z18_31260 [Trinickia dabaoshanensis]